MRPELAAFVEHARARGMDHGTIRVLLIAAGWKERDVIEALAKTSLALPIPAPPDRGGAREAFFHLLTFAAFYTTAIASVVLLFHYVDRQFPDPALSEMPERWRLSAIRWSLAFVIIAFPVFLWFSRMLLTEMRADPERSWSPMRRWLTYLTLFLAAIALGGDLITLVFQLLEGELTLRFALKVGIVLVVAGTAFVYYFLSLRLPVQQAGATRMHRSFAIFAGAIVGVTVVWGLLVAGSPGTARLLRFDERRLEDLRTIREEITNVCLGETRYLPQPERVLERPLPASLEEVARLATSRRPGIRDPQNGEPYGYEVLDGSRFRVCASFNGPRDEEHDPQWNHAGGYQCFEFDALRP